MTSSKDNDRFINHTDGHAPAAPVGNSEKTDETPVRWYKRSFIRKLGYMLVSALIAMTLWGYVLMSENPAREKRIENVPVSFSGLDSNLAVCGNLDELIPKVTVTVQTTLNDLPRFNQESVAGNIVRASVSAQEINSAGERTLYITATTSIGTIISVTPSAVTLKFDNVVERSIPISHSFIGELPEGYWHSDPQLDSSNVRIKGAESEINSIVKASFEIDLTGRTKSINDSFTLNLYDKEDNIIDSSSVVIGTLPSATVTMDILPYLEIPIQPNIIGQDRLKDIFEISSINISPNALSIAAESDVLATVNELISIEPIDISNISDEGLVTATISVSGLPEGIRLLSENQFTVTIEISERNEEISFESMPILIINQDPAMYYSYDTTVCNISFKGKASLIRSLYSWQIKLTLNMSGYDEGNYTLVPELELQNGDRLLELDYNITPVICTISPIEN